MKKISFFEPYQTELETICQKYAVEKLYAFGSVCTDRFHEHSDLDFLVRFQTIDLLEQGKNYWLLWDALEELFTRKVDLLNDKTFNNPYFNQTLEQTKTLIWAIVVNQIPLLKQEVQTLLTQTE